jgi:hypothetical protein
MAQPRVSGVAVRFVRAPILRAGELPPPAVDGRVACLRPGREG